jgi:predicted dehydrogenase
MKHHDAARGTVPFSPNENRDSPQFGRREFLQQTAAVGLAVPYVVSASAFGGPAAAPSQCVTLGFIGLGWKGFAGCFGSLLQGFIADPGCRVLAVCDVDSRYRQRAKTFVDETYGDKGCAAYHDFRDLVARPDIDAVVIATPDHWHAVQTIWACRHGKDVYCEKPLSLTIREARAMVATARRYGRVVQVGSQSRSIARLRTACEIVRSGRIGQVKEVHVSCAGPPGPCNLPAEKPPEQLDWDFWLGPAPWRPYNHGIHPVNFRYWSDYAGGGMTDWGAHHFDLAQWALGRDHTGPVEIIPPDGKEHRWLTYRYADGARVYHSDLNLWKGVTFVGTEGKAWMLGLDASTRFEPASLGRMKLRREDMIVTSSSGNQSHTQNFLDSVRMRLRPNADVEIGCRTATVCHLGNIAYQLNRPLRWDPEREEFVGDAEANRFLDRPHREPWDI